MQTDYEQLTNIIEKQFDIHFSRLNTQTEWLDLKSGAKYAGVSYNTFIKFRKLGLQVAEVDGIKRVKRSHIDRFLKMHSH